MSGALAPAQTGLSGPVTITIHRTVLAADPKHPIIDKVSKDARLLHVFVMSSYTAGAHYDTTTLRRDLDLLYAAKRGPSTHDKSTAGPINGLIIQCNAKPDWSYLQRTDAITIDRDTDIELTFKPGDRVQIRTWCNPTRDIPCINPDGTERKRRTNLTNPNDAASWIKETMARWGAEVQPRTLRVGQQHWVHVGAKASVPTPAGLELIAAQRAPFSVALRPYQFQAIVTEPVSFAEAALHGIGPSKSYGAGLLDITPLIED